MSKPFKSWVRLAIVVSLSVFTPFNTAFAGRWMERWNHRPSCRSVPVCEVGTAVEGFDACSPRGETVVVPSTSNACCDCVPGGTVVAGDASDTSSAGSASAAPVPSEEKSVPWTRIEPATPSEKPSVAKPDGEPAVEPKMKNEGAGAPAAPIAPVPVIPSDDTKGEDEPEADEAKPRKSDEKPTDSEPNPQGNDGDPAPAPSETEGAEPQEGEPKESEPSEPAVAEQPEMEESEGKDSDPKDAAEPEMTEESDRDAKGKDNEPPSEPEPSIDDLFGEPKAATPDAKKPSAEALKKSDTEESAKKIEESIDDLFGKPVNFGPSIDRVSPPAQRPSDAGNALNSPNAKPTGVSTPESKRSTEGTEKSGGKFRLNDGETKKGKGAGIEDELDRIFRSKTFVPPAKFLGAEFRTWSDNTGAYSIQARVAVIFGDKVRLLKENGKYTTVPMERLSDFDRSYVQWVAESLTYRASKIVRNNNADETSPEMAR